MKIINVLEHRLYGERRVLKKVERTGLKGPMEQKKGLYKSTQRALKQIGRTLRDKGEKDFFRATFLLAFPLAVS